VKPKKRGRSGGGGVVGNSGKKRLPHGFQGFHLK